MIRDSVDSTAALLELNGIADRRGWFAVRDTRLKVTGDERSNNPVMTI
jgi:hypothetical protein